MKRITLVVIIVIALATALHAQSNVAAEHLNVSSGRVALSGYDPVAYINAKKAVKGRPAISVDYGGARYQFATEDHKKQFLSAPVSYLPQYGGWCAYAMGAKGEKVEVDPETFKIIDGKLYLFYNKFFNNTLDSWNEDERKLKAKADQHWENIISSKP